MYSLGGLLVDRLEFSEVVDDMIGPMLQKSGARVIAVGHATCGATCIANFQLSLRYMTSTRHQHLRGSRGLGEGVLAMHVLDKIFAEWYEEYKQKA